MALTYANHLAKLLSFFLSASVTTNLQLTKTILKQTIQVASKSNIKDRDAISHKKGLDFKTVIQNLKTFHDFSHAVCVLGLVGRFLPEDLCVELSDHRQDLRVEILVPCIELVSLVSG